MMLINSLVSPTEKVVSAASDMVADVGMDRKQSIKGAKDDLRFWYEK